MVPIRLTSKPVDLSGIGPAFAVVAKGFTAPAGVEPVDIDDVLGDPDRWLDGKRTMVIVGLSHLMTPTNRVRLGRAVLRPREGLRRACVDSHLFLSEPWRMWWLFRAVGHDAPWGLTDSFLAETRWRASIEMRTPDPFGWDAVRSAMRGVVQVEDAFRFPPIAWRAVCVGAKVRTAYAREKEEAFAQEKTLPAIVARLAGIAQKAVPERRVPTIAAIFRSPPREIVRTDLAVDEFLSEAIRERVALTNAIADWDGT